MEENSGGTEIRCSVKNCAFWQEENRCSAGHILVTSDIVAGAWLGEANEAAMQSAPDSPVSKAENSCCASFVPKPSA